MAIFGYFDVSKMDGFGWRDLKVGDEPTKVPKTMCCAGFIAHESSWEAFDIDWAQMLNDFGVTELHMKYYAHSLQEFKTWKGDNAKRAAFLSQAAGIIDKHLEASVASGVSLEDYAYWNKSFQLEERYGNAYAFSAARVIDAVADWHSQSGSREPIVCFLEKGDEGQGDLRRIRNDDGYPKFRFLSKELSKDQSLPIENRKVLAFQAADFLVYETAKFANSYGQLGTLDFDKMDYWRGDEADFRKSHAALLKSTRPHMRWWAHGYLISMLARECAHRPLEP